MTALPDRFRARGFGWAIAFICLFCSLVLIATTATRIPGLDFVDADDALRFVQIHDLLAGQSWFDVSQHRINPPLGGPMHWSRIVDLPIAAVMLLLRPLVGVALADRVALSVVPLLLLCALIWVTMLAARRIAGEAEALWTGVLLAPLMTVLFQFQPLRIDHHGWQILMAAVAFWAAFDPRPVRSGAIAGLALAVWLNISSEALPYAALFGGAYALQWLCGRRAGDALFAYMPAMAVGAFALSLATKGPQETFKFYHDAISPIYLVPIAAATAALLFGRLAAKTFSRKVATLAVAAAAAGLIYFALAGGSANPFGSLDPLVYRYWYMQVPEGQPVWAQSGLVMGLILLVPLPGLIGGTLAALNADSTEESWRWAITTFLALGAFLLSLMVMRTMSVAHLFSLPGAAWVGLRLLKRARAIEAPAPRILATVGLFFVMPPGLAGAVATILPGSGGNAVVAGHVLDHPSAKGCRTAAGVAQFKRFHQGLVFAQLDLGPFILAFTSDSVVGTGHHRNIAGMRDVVTAFTRPSDQAREIVARHNSAYLAFCPVMDEVQSYAEKFPRSLSADLLAERPPLWLQPLVTGIDQPIWLYRVKP